MNGFHDVSLPARIALGARGGPEFASDVLTLASGLEVRNARWSAPRRRWQIATTAMDLDDVQILSDFFVARRGPQYSFRFCDPFDHVGQDQLLGVADGEQTHFPLLKHYGSVQRRIALPVVASLEIALDGTALLNGWDFDTAVRQVAFDTAPASGTHITASFSFDCAVRFETVRFEAVIDAPQTARLPALSLIEVLEV